MIESTIMILGYNVGRFLPSALESVISQVKNRDLEILFIDDGSEDETFEIAKSYQQKCPFMRIITQENKGQYATRNRLLEESRGDILLAIDGDDLLNSGAVKKVIDAFRKNPEIGFIYTDQLEIDENGKKISERERANCHKHFDDLILHCHFPGHLRAFRKSHLKGAKFNESIISAGDWDFLLKIYPYIKKMHIPEGLYSYRINTRGVSLTKSDKTRANSISIIKDYINKWDLYKGKSFEVIPVKLSNNLTYYDHFVDGKSTMKSGTRKVLERYLNEGF